MNNMKTYAITHISEKTNGVEIKYCKAGTIDEALQNFREGKVVKIEEVNLYGKNIPNEMIKNK
jgi:hypothetical protein|tara:strand:+ start:314 stop:502 length:189 start_codon:yes stop_codon:yes gene_type:complete